MKITVIGHILFSKLFSQYWNNKDKKIHCSTGSNCRDGKWQENNNLKKCVSYRKCGISMICKA